MPTKLEPKVVDVEAELSNAVRTYQKLAPQCTVEKRGQGIPQLAPQEKQIAILTYETDETLLCINLAKKGQHAVRDAHVKTDMRKSILTYEIQEAKLRDERAQQSELDVLNYFAEKNVIDLLKKVPSQSDELTMLENAYMRLRRMENRLDLATKRFCIVNTDNKQIREEINRLLIERNGFNIQWRRTIKRLMLGKQYLMDILEIATGVFADRDEWCRKLETLKWKGLFQLNKDISEMQSYESELNHLSKLEEFLRVKGSRRYCETDVIEEMKRLEEIARCEEEIARHDALLEQIFEFAETDSLKIIIKRFGAQEIENFSIFIILCEVLQQSIFLTKELEMHRQKIFDQKDMNEARYDIEDKRLATLFAEVSEQKDRIQKLKDLANISDNTLLIVLKGIEEIVRLALCDLTPLMSLLGNHREVNSWNVRKFLCILELEIKNIVQIVYDKRLKYPPLSPKEAKGQVDHAKQIVTDPCLIVLEPNRIETMVNYQPCAYCVEDYIMNLVFETPAVPADKEFTDYIFHLEDNNTKFGIYTLTIPEKRHAYRTTTAD